MPANEEELLDIFSLLAVAGGADYIVTPNLRDVARMELLFPGLKVAFPETLLKEMIL